MQPTPPSLLHTARMYHTTTIKQTTKLPKLSTLLHCKTTKNLQLYHNAQIYHFTTLQNFQSLPHYQNLPHSWSHTLHCHHTPVSKSSSQPLPAIKVAVGMGRDANPLSKTWQSHNPNGTASMRIHLSRGGRLIAIVAAYKHSQHPASVYRRINQGENILQPKNLAKLMLWQRLGIGWKYFPWNIYISV